MTSMKTLCCRLKYDQRITWDVRKTSRMQSLVASESGLGNGISQPQKYQNPDGHWYWEGERIYMYYVFTWCKIVLLNPHADELPNMVVIFN